MSGPRDNAMSLEEVKDQLKVTLELAEHVVVQMLDVMNTMADLEKERLDGIYQKDVAYHRLLSCYFAKYPVKYIFNSGLKPFKVIFLSSTITITASMPYNGLINK
jgi:hypothetical protein